MLGEVSSEMLIYGHSMRASLIAILDTGFYTLLFQ